MKKIILIVYFVISGIPSANSQDNLPYKSLAEFRNDTTAFMLYNFMDRADQYKGKTLKEVTADLQISIKEISCKMYFHRFRVIGLNLFTNNSQERISLREQNLLDNTICIQWEKNTKKRSNQIEA